MLTRERVESFKKDAEAAIADRVFLGPYHGILDLADTALALFAHNADFLDKRHAEIDGVEEENASLRDQLKEIKDYHAAVMREPCHDDEVHCTCVPGLRFEIKKMRDALELIVRQGKGLVTGEIAEDMNEQFHQDLAAENGLTGHPKEPRLFSIAWDHGHSSGFSEVVCWYEELSELLQA